MTSEREPTPRPAQFALWHLFALLLVVSVLLALVTQLYHVGFVAAVYVTGLAIGMWRGRLRLAAASATALGVYAVTYLAFWLPLGYSQSMEHWANRETEFALDATSSVLAGYKAKRDEFPNSLIEASQFLEDGRFIADDGWQHPLHYRRTAEGFELASFGRDGIRDGAGLDADIFWQGYRHQRPLVRLPIRQFLLETQPSSFLFSIAALISLIAGAIWYAAHPRQRRPKRQWLVSMIATAALAVIVAVVLAVFYVAASQLGY